MSEGSLSSPHAPSVRPPPPLRALQNINPLAVAAGIAVLLGIVLRLFARPDLPLWLDEAWTGAIIAQSSLGDVLHETLRDANAPLYFALMHGWSLLFGLSNGALRFPAFVFGALAPLVALIAIKGVPRDVSYLWCALIALWIPGIWYSQEARGYTLLLLLVTTCTVAYARLLARPDLQRAALWALLGTQCILTHYHALVLVGCQGLAYLALHRLTAVRTWPAALVFAPAFAWLLMHLPRVAEFADPQVAWFARLTPGDLPGVVVFLLGDPLVLMGLAAVALAGPVIGLRRRPAGSGAETPPVPPSLWFVVATAGAGAAVILAVAMVSTSFTSRYLIPFAPGLMLGLAIAAVRLSRIWALVPLAVVFVFAASAVVWAVEGRHKPLKAYNFEAASQALMAAGVRHVAFLWDNPVAQIADRGQLAAVGGFFFQREGYPMPVETIVVRPGQDPNPAVLAAAKRRPRGGILWLYDLDVRGTAASSHPPRIEQLDPAWRCRQMGRGRIGILACHEGKATL
jgi:hypothetical protein